MTVYGVSMMRNEADVVEGVIRHMACEVDHLIVADNLSDDGTRDILDQLATEIPLTVVDDPDPGYYQSDKMTALANMAGQCGARWIVPFDADELWSSPYGPISDALELAVGNVSPASLFDHFTTAVDPAGDDPFRTMVWRRAAPAGLPKVAFRWRAGVLIHQGNHGVDLPGPVHSTGPVLEVRHFPYRSADQFVSKSVQGGAAYEATTGLPADAGIHWRIYKETYDRHGADALRAHFRDNFWFRSPIDAGLVHDPAPYRKMHIAPV